MATRVRSRAPSRDLGSLHGGHWVTIHPPGRDAQGHRLYRHVYVRGGRIIYGGPEAWRGKNFAQAMADARLRIHGHERAVAYYESQLRALERSARRLARSMRADAREYRTLRGLRRDIAEATGGRMIAPTGRFAQEARADLPASWLRRGGLPLDEVADMLGMDANTLLQIVAVQRARGQATQADWQRAAEREMEPEFRAVRAELRRARSNLRRERLAAGRASGRRRRMRRRGA
jgi:hypothetical protein